MDRHDYYYRQKVKDTELDEGFDYAENADHNVTADHGLVGVAYGMVCSQHSPVAGLTIDVSGPGCAYDADGQRIHFAPLQTLDCSKDEDDNDTAVLVGGNKKWLLVSAAFTRQESDPRTDGYDLDLFFLLSEYFELHVKQGSEAITPTRPPLDADKVALCDIQLSFGDTQILNAAIDITRRQDIYVSTLGGAAYREGTSPLAMLALAQRLRDHITLVTAAHAATAISAAVSSTWEDGSTVAAVNVNAALNEIVSDLAQELNMTSCGANRIGSGTVTNGSPWSLAAASIEDQLSVIVGLLNGFHSQVTPGSSYIGCTAKVGSPSSLLVGTLDAQITALLALDNARLLKNGSESFNGVFYPDGNGTRDIGLTGTRWKEIFAYTMQAATRVYANKIQPYEVGSIPANADERDSLVLRNLVKCCGGITGATGAISGKYWNIDSVAHVGGSGAYQITVSWPLESTTGTAVVTPRGTDPTRKAMSFNRSTTNVFWIYTKDDNAFVDFNFGFQLTD